MSLFNQIAKTSLENMLDPLSFFVANESNVEEPVVEPEVSPVVDQFPKRTEKPNESNRNNSIGSNPLLPEKAFSNFATPDRLKSTAHKEFQLDADQGDFSDVSSVASPPSVRRSKNSTDEDGAPLLTGESKVMELKESAFIQITPGRLVAGVLLMTNYRISFIPSPSHLNMLAAANPSIHSYLNIPVACIDKIDKEKKPRDSRTTGSTIILTCKDVRQIRITIRVKHGNDEVEADKVINIMHRCAFPNQLRHMFAFQHCLPGIPGFKTVAPYEPILEFSRQGLLDVNKDSSEWRVCNANVDFRLCKTYPKLLVMPRKMSDEELFQVAAFRSGHRLPVLSWGDRGNGATLWRSSQPKAGMSGACAVDEKFLDLLAQSCAFRKTPLGEHRPCEPILCIVDCRPKSNAMANRAAGAGYENQSNYPTTRLDFYNIPNIHVMRDSYRGLCSLMTNTSSSSDANFTKYVEDTQWIHYVRMVIKASWETANFLWKGLPVLVHCSHGWDRTAQVCSVTQLFLDPFYRTIDGFQVLVEKEWCAFGHPFQMRCAHAQDKANRQDDQFSPIFLQFLDCVWQILHQQPHYFEFNARYLVALADTYYSGRFGTFLFSSDYDREVYGARQCLDVWTYLHYNRHVLTNPLFMDPNRENTPTTHVLLPPLPQLLRNVTLWTDYFFRWSSNTSIISAPEPLVKALVDGNGLCQASVSAKYSNRLIQEYGLPENSRFLDVELPAIVTGDDIWEAAFRRERAAKEKLEHSLARYQEESKETEADAGPPVEDDNALLSPERYNKEEVATLKESLLQKTSMIDTLRTMLLSRGVTEEAIDKELEGQLIFDGLMTGGDTADFREPGEYFIDDEAGVADEDTDLIVARQPAPTRGDELPVPLTTTNGVSHRNGFEPTASQPTGTVFAPSLLGGLGPAVATTVVRSNPAGIPASQSSLLGPLLDPSLGDDDSASSLLGPPILKRQLTASSDTGDVPYTPGRDDFESSPRVLLNAAIDPVISPETESPSRLSLFRQLSLEATGETLNSNAENSEEASV